MLRLEKVQCVSSEVRGLYQDITNIERRRYNGRPTAIEVTWSNGGKVRVELFTSVPFRDEAYRRLLSVWRRGITLGPQLALESALCCILSFVI